MFCTNCGTELPDVANFCSNCGLQLKEGVQRQNTTRTQWEYCFITWKEDSPGKEGGLFSEGEPRTLRFWAMAVGPQGHYNAGDSSTFQSQNDPSMWKKGVSAAFWELLSKLLKDGWEPYSEHFDTYDGPSSWQKAFKRPVVPER